MREKYYRNTCSSIYCDVREKCSESLKDGFLINVKKTFENIKFLVNKSWIGKLKDEDNFCISFDNLIKTMGNEILDCHILTYGQSYNLDVDIFINEVVINKKYDYFESVRGDFILAAVTSEKILIFNSLESQYELFWSFENDTLKASTYHYFVSNDIDDTALALLCYGENINPFKHMKILKRGQMLVLEKEGNVSVRSIENNFFIYDELCNMTLPELSEIAYELLKKSIKRKLYSTSKVGLMLSGGIDSSALARALYDLNIDATFITWASKNSKVDEGKYAEKLSEYLGYKLKKINVDSDVGLMPKLMEKHFPYTHAVSSWWEAACDEAKSCGINVLLSGHYAGIFDGDFTFSGYSNLRDKISGALHAYANPLFTDKFFSQNKKKNRSGRDLYHENNLFRKIEIYTSKARNIILNYVNGKIQDDMSMLTQEYSYMINMFEPNGISHCSPYLDAEIMSFCRALPLYRKNCYCDGQNINKIVLRYSMLEKIPHDIISRYYSANLSYMTQINLQKFFNEDPQYFDSNSILVKKGIIDLDRTTRIIKSSKDLQSNEILSIAVLVENWLRGEENR